MSKKKLKFKFNPLWIFVSFFIYILIRIVEYTTGDKGNPEWVIDFFPYILPLMFCIVDNIMYNKGDDLK
jgi:5'(3')-deoxyribonucleotidase